MKSKSDFRESLESFLNILLLGSLLRSSEPPGVQRSLPQSHSPHSMAAPTLIPSDARILFAWIKDDLGFFFFFQ